MEDARTLEDYKQARAEYYRLFRGCEWRRCFWCGEFFKVRRNNINALLASSMYCSENCRKSLQKLLSKFRQSRAREAKPKTQYDWVLDMSKPESEWEFEPQNA